MPASVNDVDVRRHLARLVFLGEPLDAFIDWFHSALWDIERSASSEDLDLVYRVENRLAELSGGYVDDAETINGLRDDAIEYGVSVASQPAKRNARVRLIPLQFSAPQFTVTGSA